MVATLGEVLTWELGQQAFHEQKMQNNVLDPATAQRVFAYHTYNSRRSSAGFLGLVLIGPGVIFRELKSQSGQLSRQQA